MRILLIEDDKMIGAALAGSLKDAGDAVDWVEDGVAAETALAAHSYDLVLLDLGLPGQDGLKLLAHIRTANQDLPVLIVTARDDIDSHLSGLDGGADDYIIKPFDLAELRARIRAVLRRRSGLNVSCPSNGVLTLDTATHQVHIVGQPESILLSNKEFAVLNALLLRPGTIYSRQQLEDKLYGWGEEVESNAVDSLIHSLRRKIGKDHIKNIRGAGWLVARESTADSDL